MNCHQTYHPFLTKLCQKSPEKLFYLWLKFYPILFSRFGDTKGGLTQLDHTIPVCYDLFALEKPQKQKRKPFRKPCKHCPMTTTSCKIAVLYFV